MKVSLICNAVALVFFLVLLVFQMLEAQAYTGNLFGFFQ